MKTRILSLVLMAAFSLSSYAQKISTRNGYIKFFSETSVENIKAENNQVSSVIDLETGQFAFLVQIKAFQFEKALMQEHFNENYMESGKYPKASFKGNIAGFEKLDLSKDGKYEVNFEGTMTIHGTDRTISEPATIMVKGGEISLTSSFNLSPEEYGVEIPASKRDNIAESLEITVKMNYDKK
ncbi:MAG: YceI family protein [Owenweeksia sp.]